MKYLSLSIPGYGQIESPKDIPTGGFTTTPGMPSTAEDILQTGISLLFILGIILVLFYIIWGGIEWIMSRGDKGKVESARNKITWAIIGLFVVFLSVLIINTVGYFFKVDFFGINTENATEVESANPNLEGKWGCFVSAVNSNKNVCAKYKYPERTNPLDSEWHNSVSECADAATIQGCEIKG